MKLKVGLKHLSLSPKTVKQREYLGVPVSVELPYFRLVVPAKYRINIIHAAHDSVVNFQISDMLEPQETG